MRKVKTLFMETTKIDPEQTVSQIQRVLGEHGAGAVMTEYDKGEVSALTFKIKIKDKDIPFRLPCRWNPIEEYLNLKYPPGSYYYHGKELIRDNKLQAKQVAWRQILRWVEAQMALVETDMVKIQEVFMPYIQVSITGQTLYEKLELKGMLMLEEKK